MRGFLDRVWRLIVDERAETMELNAAVQNVEPTDEQNRVLHKTIQAVTHDIERLAFNTAIARMMEFTNYFTKADGAPARGDGEVRAAALALRAAHRRRAVATPGPQEDAGLRALADSSTSADSRKTPIEMPVQINGKLRGKITVPAGADQADHRSRRPGRRQDRRAARRQDDRQSRSSCRAGW